MDTDALLNDLRSLSGRAGQIVHVERIPEHEAKYGTLDVPLPSPLVESLAHLGISRLYSHKPRLSARCGQASM